MILNVKQVKYKYWRYDELYKYNINNDFSFIISGYG